MMQLKDLCLSLVQCESEPEIIDILKTEKYWDNPENWHYFGGDENNFSIIGNQQSKPEAAIVEKIINSVDAVLMGECYKRGIKPDGENAPKSIKDALIHFFKIDEGKLTNIPAKERSKLAENICLVVTGEKTNPTYTIIDKGEGQTPAKLHDTILSLRKSNKLRIPFVQGKFNMGGTGVFRFCGETNIQLIVSRRNPEIAINEGDPTKDFWGFTVIRREDPIQGARSSNYKYLAPSKMILFFPGEELPLLPSEYPNAYGNSLESGTFIKFFEYKIGAGLRTNILFDLYNKLSLLMPHIALPVKLYERRKGYSGHSFETILSGLSVRIDEDKIENIEENFPTSGTMTISGQKMRYSIYVFKRGKHQKYTKDEGIIFTINGQTHGYLSKSFFNRKAVGLGYLAESILVILDCSEIDGRAREDLFMNSRDRLSSCPLKTDIEISLEELLKNHQGLRGLKEKRKREEIENKLQESQPLVDVLQDVLRKSPTLSRLFLHGKGLSNPFNTISTGKEEEFIGKEFPTYFTLIKKFPHDKPKLAHYNSKFRVDFKTDVSNNYFDRSKDPGTFKVFINGKESKDASINLWNGFAHLNVLIEDYKIGDLLNIHSEISDVSRYKPIDEDFFVLVAEPVTKSPPGNGNRKPPSSDKPGKDSTSSDGFALPNIIEVTKDGRSGHNWDEQSFDDNSALRVKGSVEDGYDYFVNIDNIHLLTELKAAKGTEIQAIEAKYKFGLVLIGIALLQEDNNKNQNEEEEDIFERIYKTSKAISPILIPMIDSLGAIEIHDIISMPEEIQ
ncbi:hypothetical protein [Proteiniphilum acetatigenes]|uniref:hypothetical protein n=1 Tax=Proteiniphilum acetatigenes TaxID=294710 RepID=UPI000371B1FD|nr:hypothetical protein [Proteiniphilum acetatigenes]